jgi:pimeloyl-ACP methyl ester carboxylesterase
MFEKAVGTSGKGVPTPRPEPWELRYLPFDYLLRSWGRIFTPMGTRGLTRLNDRFPLLYNPKRVVPENILWLLTWGGEKEPLKVTRQFARWIRNNELKCYRTNYDFRANFDRITIPIAIIFGDEDRLANLRSTRAIYRKVSSEYLLWRPVRGNSHMELTMGHDIRQICYDIKNLMEYAITHKDKRPSLPRVGADNKVRTDLQSRKARILRLVR